MSAGAKFGIIFICTKEVINIYRCNLWKFQAKIIKNHVFRRPKLEIRMRMSSILCNRVSIIKTDSDAKSGVVLICTSRVMGLNK